MVITMLSISVRVGVRQESVISCGLLVRGQKKYVQPFRCRRRRIHTHANPLLTMHPENCRYR